LCFGGEPQKVRRPVSRQLREEEKGAEKGVWSREAGGILPGPFEENQTSKEKKCLGTHTAITCMNRTGKGKRHPRPLKWQLPPSRILTKKFHEKKKHKTHGSNNPGDINEKEKGKKIRKLFRLR